MSDRHHVPETPPSETFEQARARIKTPPASAGSIPEDLAWLNPPEPRTLHGHTVLALAQNATLALVVHAEEWELMESGNIPSTALQVARVEQLHD